MNYSIMKKEIIFKEDFFIKGQDYINGGDASCKISNILKDIGVDPDIILRISVASYEAEMNVVMYAKEGILSIYVSPKIICLEIKDQGPGIPDIKKAMQPGYSTASDEMREWGFGAGMGLPNIKENADTFDIISKPGLGTHLKIMVNY